ncbi:ABC transporter permease [Beduini massiliensis]|uniref:ABC transporter permease n=1 Tax=Beduini massiliensis TaxID=1585974 RepID=UPI00059AA525|nr:ABC transporter permease [Beduini massiliensis]
MTVYKLYLKLIRRNSKSILLYLFIFVGIFFMFAIINSSEKTTNSFKEVKPAIAYIDEEQSQLSLNLKDYLSTITVMSDIDSAENAKDALFFGDIAACITIPQGFSEQFNSQQSTNIQIEQREDESNAMLVQQYINSYLQSAATYQKNTTLSLDEIHAQILADQSVKTEISFALANPEKANDDVILRQLFFNYLSFISLSVTILIVGIVMHSINNSEIRKRNLAAPIKSASMNIQMFLGNLTFSIGLWLLFMIIISIFSNNMLNSVGFTYMLNSLVFFLVALSIAFLAANLIVNVSHPTELLSAITNILGLGMTFLGGAFVPQKLISDTVLAISRFTPTYWYVLVNDKLVDLNEPTLEIFQYIGIQSLFAIACFILSMVVYKNKRVQESI